MSKIFRILLWFSLIFFAWYLYRADYLVFDKISFNWLQLSISLVFLFAGFLGVCLSWGIALMLRGNPVRFSDAIISQGIYIFSKYIPGKLWVILGRASYFSNDKTRLRSLSMISLQEQLIFLFWGLVLSLPPTLFITKRPWIGMVISAGMLLMVFLLFSGWFHRLSSGLLERIFKKDFDFRPMELSFFIKVSGPVLLFWILWSAGFWFLMSSMHDGIPSILALTLPAGMTYGFIVIFVPAGIGVREGILASFLIAGGLTPGSAVTISVISRFWFVSGEIFLFLLSVIMKFTGGKDAGYPECPST